MNLNFKDKIEYYSKLEKLKEKYPDLSDTGTTRWSKNLVISNFAKIDMNDVEFSNSCGCCAVYVRPYLEIDDIRIYANPVNYCIGSRDSYYYGINAGQYWENELHNNEFNQTIIDKTKLFLKQNEVVED